jgi:myo-inositol-hexaphosphate 3-phosphohydrolase
MSKNQLREATDWLNDRFCFLESKDGEVATIDSIISRTKDALLRLGINGLLIDPYNFIENRDSRNEHQSISEMLSKIICMAQAHQLVVFFVAHPTKRPFDQKEKPLDGNAISGSYSWLSKSDYGVSLFRTSDPNDHTPVVSVWKARFPWIAKRGEQKLQYDVATGRFSDLPDNFDWSMN